MANLKLEDIYMQYSICKKFDIDQMCHLRKSVGWNELKAMISNPQMENLFSIICTENGKMIGFLNVVSNNVTDAYIQDVMVAPEFQGKGRYQKSRQEASI